MNSKVATFSFLFSFILFYFIKFGFSNSMSTVDEIMDNSVKREKYCLGGWEACKADRPASIGMGQTISAPHMHRYALLKSIPYLLNKNPMNGDDVSKNNVEILDIGCGSGYLTVAYRVLADKLGIKQANVLGIDIYPELVEFSRKNYDSDIENKSKYSDTIKFEKRDGYSVNENEKYNVIHVGAAATDGHAPPNLIKALKRGGILIIPIRNKHGYENMNLITKDINGEIGTIEDISVRYVPLVRERQ